jgi:TonB family protein
VVRETQSVREAAVKSHVLFVAGAAWALAAGIDATRVWAQAERTPAAVVERTPPAYPAWAIGSGVSTEVLLRLRIGPEGKVQDVLVPRYTVKNDILTREMRAAFDSAAVRAVKTWTFRPAIDHGHAAAAWLDVAVPFEDPGAAPPDSMKIVASADRIAPADSLAAAARVATEGPLPMARESARAAWPAAASYACHGQVDVLVEVDSAGMVRGARVDQRRYQCVDTTLAAAIDSAAVRAAWRWRFEPAPAGRRPVPVTTSIPFRIPNAVASQLVVVGCVRDSLTGRDRPHAEILSADGRVLGRADDTGWFVLTGVAIEAKKIRAQVPCFAGGFRAVRTWKGPGDVLKLYASQNTCSDTPGR